jgi:hypothetical protein
MDIVGHILLGAAVSGKLTLYTVGVSLLPDIGALPLQYKKSWNNPEPWMLAWYRLWHSPLALLLAYFLPGPGFLIYATHVVSDMVTHHRPYSDFPVFQWGYRDPAYWLILLTLGVIAWLRLFS